MTDYHLINIILNGIESRLWQAIPPYEDLCCNASKWKKKLLHMDFIITKFQKKEQHNVSKGQGKTHSLEEQVQLRGEESECEKKKCEFVLKEVWDKRKIEERCIKCGRSNHQARDCKASLRAKTSAFSGNTNQEPVQKKRKFNNGHLKITELGSEEDLVNK